MAKKTPKPLPLDRDLNEMGQRKVEERREPAVPEAFPGAERRKVVRRRQIDPTTCERDYSAEEIEFMHAMDEYKRRSGRMFPTCSEILEVVASLGYRRVAGGCTNACRPAPVVVPSPTESGTSELV
jgi:hypothetical protein